MQLDKLKQMDFYDEIAGDYDDFTNLAVREAGIQSFLNAVQARHSISSVLDVACGTGSHVVKSAQMGKRAVGVDISAGMIEQSQARAKKAGVQATWAVCPMQELAGTVEGKFDLILCLGNSIPHVLKQSELVRTVAGFAHLLNSGGILLVHLLNYTKILAEQKRIVAVNRVGDDEYIRFYDFVGELVNFNLLKITWQGTKNQHRLMSTPLFPYTPGRLEDCLLENGFAEVNIFGDLQFNPFDEKTSEAVLLEARVG
ncbi:MAG: class I SAM-dependent methyltransferase [Sedimentisphaerales bacterium]|nr:class I SAM-dependent methyltransferase [Sedimentisphaerales bacterium]